MGYPDFPKFGTPANCASAGFWVKKDVGKERDDFLEKVSYLWHEMLRDSINYSFLIIGFHESDSMIPAVENGKHILYKSRFYEVSWDGKQISGTRGIRMEVALL